MKRIYAFMVVIAIFPLAAFAHEGHGHFHGFGLMHYLSSPLHLAPVLLALGLGAYLAYRRYFRAPR
jgi:hypothetical protein